MSRPVRTSIRRWAIPLAGVLALGAVSLATPVQGSESASADERITYVQVGADRLECTITGTDDGDILVGTDGDDVICGLGNEDFIECSAGQDVFLGGAGFDVADCDEETVSITVDLHRHTIVGSGTTHTQSMEMFRGSPLSDYFWGNGFVNSFVGGAGNDKIFGNGGNDELFGADGDDWIIPGKGDDNAYAGTGADKVTFGAANGVTVDLIAGTATGQGTDDLVEFEDIGGSHGNDTLRGTDGPNVIGGSKGDDSLFGLGGNDDLRGSSGTDLCNGGAGTDSAITCEVLVSIP